MFRRLMCLICCGGTHAERLKEADMILLGGSGHYSAAGEGVWLERALDAMREIHDLRGRRLHPAGDFKRWPGQWAGGV